MTLAEAARIIRNEYGATESTLRDHEAVLARMSLTLADRDPIEVSIADLRDVHRPLGRALATHSPEGDVRVRAFWVGRGVTQGLSMHLARHTFATDLEVAMDAHTCVGSNSNGRTKSFLPKLTAESAQLSRRVEAAGIEPASAVAPG